MGGKSLHIWWVLCVSTEVAGAHGCTIILKLKYKKEEEKGKKYKDKEWIVFS